MSGLGTARVARGLLCAALGVGLAAALPVLAADQNQILHAKASDVKVLDLALVDQDGSKVSFRTDVVGDAIVVMNFIFTSCPSICPIQSAIFANLQRELSTRGNEDVRLVSLSIAPTTDVPARLREYAQRYDAGSQWRFITGDKEKIDRVLVGLGAYSRVVEEHSAMVLVGDGRTDHWTRFYGFPKATALLESIDELLDARNGAEQEKLER